MASSVLEVLGRGEPGGEVLVLVLEQGLVLALLGRDVGAHKRNQGIHSPARRAIKVCSSIDVGGLSTWKRALSAEPMGTGFDSDPFALGREGGSSGRRCQSRDAFRLRLHAPQMAHVMHTHAKNAARATGTRTLAWWRAILYHPSPVDFVPRPDDFGNGGGDGEGGGGGDGGGGEGGGVNA